MTPFIDQTPLATLVFVLTIITSLYAFYFDQSLIDKFILQPYEVAKGKKIYTLITSGLIHKDWMHLLFNMMTFYFFAFTLEKIIGSIYFGLIYFLGLILSNIPSVLRHKNNFWFRSLGASGAISAVLFSYILFFPLNKMMIFPIPIPIPAILFGFLYLIYCYYMSRRSEGTINHDAHFFGALAGIILTFILIPGVLQEFIEAF